MNTYLLYPDREWQKPEYYYDEKNIVQDLGLNTLFTIASKEVIMENGMVKKLGEPDLYVKDVMHRVMLTPVLTERELKYRQNIIADCIKTGDMISEIYHLAAEMTVTWDHLGRNVVGSNSGRDNASRLSTEILEFRLFIDTLSKLKEILAKNISQVNSEGLRRLYSSLLEEYSDETEDELKKIEQIVSFYMGESSEEYGVEMVNVPRIVMSCHLGAGCKLKNFEIKDVETVSKRYRDPKSAIAKVQGYINSLTPDSASCESGTVAVAQTHAMEYSAVRYMMNFTVPFRKRFEEFFDKLHFQSAFYYGALLISRHMKRFNLKYSFPNVCGKERLAFKELKEFVMCIEQRVNAIGNTCEIDPKMLVIITGANQGGKSTFLRSIGIAQVMMQCGLMVAAESFESHIFPSLFMHFTRREDSEMNSGRLDEELGRMSRIVDNLGPDSLILLNESFATTTEKDGSEIAYDIIKAFNEVGVKIITVTHLLSFARRVYDECTDKTGWKEGGDVTFFCAERRDDGSRTFRMKQSVPELTSFGLDLYEKIIEQKV